MPSLLALTFHQIGDADAGRDIDSAVRRYFVRTEIFSGILEQLSSDRCYRSGDLSGSDQQSGWILTFDDGFSSDFEVVFPLLAQMGLRGTFYITAENLGRSGYLSVGQAREMAEGGMEIGSHGLTHRYLVTMPRSEAAREISDSKKKIEQSLGIPVTSYAPVGGHFRRWMLEQAWRSGYTSFATMIPGSKHRRKRGRTILRRNHAQFHNDSAYLTRLLSGDMKLMACNRLRYSGLHLAQRILGLERYDHLKSLLVGRE